MSPIVQAQLINLLVMFVALHLMAHFIQKFTGLKVEKALIKAEKKLFKWTGKASWALITWPFKLLKPRAKAAAKTTRTRLGP